MIHTDEELQDKVEKGHWVDSLDARAYQKVFEALKKEPYDLPTHFADKIISRAEARGSSLSKDYFWFGLGLFSFVVATIIAVLLTDFSLNFGAFKFISGSSSLLVFSAAFIILIQYLDKQLVKNKMST